MTNAELKASLEAALKANRELASQFQQQQAQFESLRNSVASKPNTKPNNEASVEHNLLVWENPEVDVKIYAARELGEGEKNALNRGLELMKRFNGNSVHLHQGLVFTNLNSATKLIGGKKERYHRTAKGYFQKVS
jgi:hypothetical protein